MVPDQAAAEWRCPGFYYSLRFFSLFIFIHNSCSAAARWTVRGQDRTGSDLKIELSRNFGDIDVKSSFVTRLSTSAIYPKAGTIEDTSMAGEQENAVPGSERRREQRHPVSAVYQRYITLKVKIDDVFVSVILHNFSGSGVLFESRVPFEIKSYADCVISLPQSLSREITFAIRVRHCQKKNTAFFIGAAIEAPVDATWFNIFREVHDFIMQRQGEVY
jgi:hypothetical protein